ncbi:MAG: hypothetical protein M3Z07_02035 [Candidatus Eremiobacteraeota bacterium]|nr:hypothetical protein [Candidatus Eremiobacteraeota bacterium]MDQ6823265.1 hypothetical protein [Candidatus Eremiobacteraeota bacterium]
MTKRRIAYETRSARARRGSLMRLGIWIFLILFAVSVVGVAFTFGSGGK